MRRYGCGSGIEIFSSIPYIGEELGGKGGKFPWLSFSGGGGEAPPWRFGPPNNIKKKNWKSMPRRGSKSCPGNEKISSALRARRTRQFFPPPANFSSTLLHIISSKKSKWRNEEDEVGNRDAPYIKFFLKSITISFAATLINFIVW